MAKFVMLGERNSKGRIVKNESYTINNFIKNIGFNKIKTTKPKGNWFIKTFSINYSKNVRRYNSIVEHNKNIDKINKQISDRIKEMINNDKVGRK